MRKLIFTVVAIAILAIGYLCTSNPIDTCPPQVQKIAIKFAKHAESKIIDAHFTKTEVSLSGDVVRHYYDVVFRQGKVVRIRRASLPVERGTVCEASFIN
jgi:hypothetical protein